MVSLRKKSYLKFEKKKLLGKTFSRVPRRVCQKSFSSKFKFLKIAIFFVFALFFYFIFFYPYFQIKKVVIVDQKLVDENRVREIAEPVLKKRRFFVFPGTNIFIIDKKRVEDFVLEQIVEIDSLEIIKKYPDVLKIKVKETKPEALWISKGEYYFLDKEGVVRGKVSDPSLLEKENIYKIVDQNNKEVKIKENVLYAKHLSFIKTLYEKLPEIKVNIREIILPSVLAEEIHVRTDKDWRVFFTLDRDFDQQLANLKLVLESEILGKLKEEELDYIDLRVENWVYYRKKISEQENKEKENKEEKLSTKEENTTTN